MKNYQWIIVLFLCFIAGFFVLNKSNPVELKDESTASKNKVNMPDELTKMQSNKLEEAKAKPSLVQTDSRVVPLSSTQRVLSKSQKDEQSKDVIENIPASYSIDEADKYFISPENRGPGHIGGPPPLLFPH